MMIPTIIIIGASGLIAQVTVFRELLVSFHGNELTLGVILANWMLLEAGGVYLLGRTIRAGRNKTALLALLQVIFVFGLYAAIYCSRTFKHFSGIFFGESLSLGSIYSLSFLCMSGVALSHGALFALCCEIFPEDSKKPYLGIGKVYTWEILGTILGGIALTYILIPHLDSFRIARLLGLLNLGIVFVHIRPEKKRFRTALSGFLGLCFLAVLFSDPSLLQKSSLSRQFKSENVVYYRNTPYGNIAATRDQSQTAVFYNGLPEIISPYPDISSLEEFGTIPLLFHPRPEKILLIEGGRGGLIEEILKFPSTRLDYLELDPGIQDAVRAVGLVSSEPGPDSFRFKVFHQDSRIFLRSCRDKYDLILLGSSGPADLVNNRIFTREFFGLVKARLKKEGMIAFRLPGSLTYLSKQLGDLNFSVINSLKDSFAGIRVLPGDLNLILGSDSRSIALLDAKEINRRMQASGRLTRTLVPAYIDYRMDPEKEKWFNHATRGATRKKNRDFVPLALFQSLILWNRQFSPFFSGIFSAFSESGYFGTALAVILVFLIFLLACGRPGKTGSRNPSLIYCLASTGFWGMMAGLLLVFSFQVSFGYLYKQLGLLTAVFMAGTALSSGIARRLPRPGNMIRGLLLAEAAMVIFSMILSFWLLPGMPASAVGMAGFIALFLISGCFLGWEFVLCAGLYDPGKSPAGKTAGNLYAADLLGGCLAGFIGGIWLVPVLGLAYCGAVLSLLKLTSFVLLKKNINNG